MSATIRERELKLGVPDAASLEALMTVAGGKRDDPVRQVNHFFDSPGAGLRSRRIGLRIREEGANWTLALKGPTSEESAGRLVERIELEASIEPAVARAVIEGGSPVVQLLDRLDLSRREVHELAALVREVSAAAPLVHVGSFENERTRVRTRLADFDVELELDRTRFAADEVRFELELELQPGQSAEILSSALEDLFARAGVEPQPTTSKLVRFQEILDAQH